VLADPNAHADGMNPLCGDQISMTARVENGVIKELKYDGPIVILINKGSGSATELFSGVMQKQRRAVLMGQNSAGQVMLKSMFHFDDESMVLLITARGHYPDGSVFSFGGLNPDRFVQNDEEDKIINYATEYLMYVNIKGDPLKEHHG
jgi:C-terminal processing protease CtpA/Prc